MTQFFTKIQRLKSFSSGIVTLLLLALPAPAIATEYGSLGFVERAELTPSELTTLPEFCRGTYRVPIIQSLEGNQIEAESDQTQLAPGGDTVLSGNVVMQQQNRILKSERANWFHERAYGEFEGNVALITPDLILEGDSATADQQSGIVNFYNAQYSLPARHLRGTASHIQTIEGGKSHLASATFTFCEPGSNDWDLAASELNLDQEKGIGSAWHTRLRIAEVPVLYVPYYRFPIGDQRMTGFLNPSFSFNSQLQAEDVQIPFYLNIAPNLDATLTPHYVRDHGTILESQLRHKTRLLGDGELNYAYLNEDDTSGEKRFLLNYKQSGRFGNGWQHRWLYYNVSDDDYLNDMSPTAAVDRTTHLPRRGEILWDQGSWHFDVTAEEFQTIDTNIALQNRPYGRLPQFNLSYTPLTINDWQLQQRFQATRFSRKSDDIIAGNTQTLTGFAALNGDRLLSDTALSYPLEWPFGFVTPTVEYRQRLYNLRDADAALLADPNTPDLNASIGSARYSLDSGLFFEREVSLFNNGYQQTLEPRLMYVYSPYVDGQNNIPNFDSTLQTVTYSNLFSGERFTGGDRLADLNQVSMGITSRFIRDDGFEKLRLSLGQVFYFADRQVQLNRTNTVPTDDMRNTSSVLAEAEWNPFKEWSLFSTLEWDPYENFARQARTGVRYQNDNNQMFSIASNQVQNHNSLLDRVQTSTNQIDAGAFWALSDRWALVGRMLYDIRSYEDGQKEPRSPVLESLAGIEYQNCCWRIQALYRESSQQETNAGEDYSTRKRYGFLFSFQLKGLGNFGAGIDSLMNEGISGYSRRTYHDY